jgi:hypothetical protein
MEGPRQRVTTYKVELPQPRESKKNAKRKCTDGAENEGEPPKTKLPSQAEQFLALPTKSAEPRASGSGQWFVWAVDSALKAPPSPSGSKSGLGSDFRLKLTMLTLDTMSELGEPSAAEPPMYVPTRAPFHKHTL